MSTKAKKVGITLLFFFIAGLCEIGGGYLVWLWVRDGVSWMFGAVGGFILFLYEIVPNISAITFSQNLRRIWRYLYRHGCSLGWIFEGIAPDRFDIFGAAIALAGVAFIFYMPRKGEEKSIWSK